ncbi:MAG TPA: glycosyltransferase family 9 protein [Pyrinomonadaceae bacterium]|jgi:ADP-heptose:LPS heptosyltransferase|nr:glycosyltransferase family 9 protein [Pyrinomonadaceae bacterium]
MLLEAEYPAVFFINGYGDHLLALPALRALAALFPGRLALICARGARSEFFRDLDLRAVIEIEIRWTKSGRVFDAGATARRVKSCDLLLSLNPWHTRPVDRLLRSLSPAHSIGFFPSFEITLPLNFAKHSADLSFDVPRYLCRSARIDDFAGPPAFAGRFQTRARNLRALVPDSQKVLAVHADTKREKMWPVRRLVKVLNLFLDRHPQYVVMDIGLKDLRLDRGVHRGRIIPCCHLPLPLSMSLVAEANLFLGVDSCMLHAADLFRIPGVGLFGPTNVEEWGFRFGGPHRHVSGNGSMNSITETQVLEALESLI